MTKTFITNEKGQRIAVVVESDENDRGLAFVMHGLSGHKEQSHIRTIARAFRQHGYTVVTFDTTNTFGESDGRFEDATIGNYYDDLKTVIAWAKTQPWYREPFALAGHSLGGICTALYAEQHPEEVSALAPISTVVSGALSLEASRHLRPELFREWKETGWRVEPSARPGIIKRLPWSHALDRLRYDLLPHADQLTMPVLLIVGEHDTSTPPEHIAYLFDVLPGEKELHIVRGAPHTFTTDEHLAEVEAMFDRWLISLANI